MSYSLNLKIESKSKFLFKIVIEGCSRSLIIYQFKESLEVKIFCGFLTFSHVLQNFHFAPKSFLQNFELYNSNFNNTQKIYYN